MFKDKGVVGKLDTQRLDALSRKTWTDPAGKLKVDDPMWFLKKDIPITKRKTQIYKFREKTNSIRGKI